MRPKIALVHPRFHYPSGDLPIGILGLAAFLRERLPVDVVLCDTTFRRDFGYVRRFLEEERPDLVGIGSSTLMIADAREVARLARSRNALVFLGGPHPTVDSRSVLAWPEVDAVVIGEGEASTLDLVEMLLSGQRRPVAGCLVRDSDGGVLEGPARPPLPDLDALPFPAWDLVDMPAYLRSWGQLGAWQPGLPGANLMASRGCPFHCAFCQPVLTRMFGPGQRVRSPDHVAREVETLHRLYGIRGFWLNDDTLTTRADWLATFADALGRRVPGIGWGCNTRGGLMPPDLLGDLARAGLKRVGVGLEAASDRIREGLYHKGVSVEDVRHTVETAHAAGIRTLVYVMLGAPGETWEEMHDTVRVVTSMPADEASFSLFVPLPGTAIHQEMLAQGWVLSDDPYDYDYYARQPFRSGADLSRLRLIQHVAYARFYGRPHHWPYLARCLASPSARSTLVDKLRRLGPRSLA
ncbi:MAG: radical SAM protein [Deltaproteobacteria bacterium]|nr:radical SAM protein [Deltaproteobacteria bacterium]